MFLFKNARQTKIPVVININISDYYKKLLEANVLNVTTLSRHH